MNRQYVSCADTAKLVRSALKESFPAVKFSVRSSTYSGGASIDVRWLDGPCVEQVKAITNAFEGGYFDGGIDYQGSRYHTLDGAQVRFAATFISENRDYSDAFVARAIAETVALYGGAEAISVEDYRQGRAWNWKNSGGCDLCRALNVFLYGNVDEAFACAEPSPTLARVQFTGDDGYGAGCVGTKESPGGYGGYPRADRVQA